MTGNPHFNQSANGPYVLLGNSHESLAPSEQENVGPGAGFSETSPGS